jgi:hypothetical protein
VRMALGVELLERIEGRGREHTAKDVRFSINQSPLCEKATYSSSSSLSWAWTVILDFVRICLRGLRARSE